jgi:hypothetical protein
MLIEPLKKKSAPSNLPSPQQKQTSHWILMSVLWILLIFNVVVVIGVQLGSSLPLIKTTTARESAFFTVNLLMALYTIGITLFFVSYRLLNRRHPIVYTFFKQLNSLVLTAFIVLFILIIMTI